MFYIVLHKFPRISTTRLDKLPLCCYCFNRMLYKIAHKNASKRNIVLISLYASVFIVTHIVLYFMNYFTRGKK